MKLAYHTITWGGVVGHPGGVTSVKDSYYMANGSTEEALRDISDVGYPGFELFEGNLAQYADSEDELRTLMDELTPGDGWGVLGCQLNLSRNTRRRVSQD